MGDARLGGPRQGRSGEVRWGETGIERGKAGVVRRGLAGVGLDWRGKARNLKKKGIKWIKNNRKSPK